MAQNTFKGDILYCDEQDLPTCFDIITESFQQDSPYINEWYPGHNTPTGKESGTKRLIKWWKGAKDSIFLKAVIPVDTTQEEQQPTIIGFAVWTHLKAPPPVPLESIADVEEVWPNLDDREFMQALWAGLAVPRGQAVKEAGSDGIYILEFLAVHPDYHRRGAGVALVNYGLNIADERGLESIVEGTPIGLRTYLKCGFQPEIERMEFQVDKKFGDRPVPPLTFLRRPRK